MAGLFPLEFEDLDITKKEMITVMAAIKHWFIDLANLKVKIFVDNQACVALLNYGVSRSPILAACVRELILFWQNSILTLGQSTFPLNIIA